MRSNFETPRRGGAHAFFDRLAGRYDAHRQRARLHAMSDHLLSDIGVARDQIDDAFRAALGSRPRG